MSSEVPTGWDGNNWTIQELSALVSDKELGTTRRGVGEKNISLIKMGNLQDGKVSTKSVEFLEYADDIECLTLQSGDFLFNTRNTPELVGKVATFLGKERAVFDNNILRLRFFDFIDSIYMGYFFNLSSSRRNLKKIVSGTTSVAAIYWNDLKTFIVPTPPLPEQKKIASILTSVDEVIENTQKQIDKLQDLKKATMNELLTKGIGHTEFKDSELGRIPKSWEVKKLGVFAKVKGGKRLPKGEQFSETMTEYPYIRVSDFENQGINKTRLKYVSGRVRESIKRYVISSKDLYISIAGSIGIIGTIPDELSGSLLTENAAKIVLESNVITRDFLKCNLSSEIAQSQFRQEKGTGGGVPKLALFRIEETVVALPKIDEQLQISSTIASLDKAISDMDSKLSQTQSLKKSLMQDLLTGKVRVTVN